MNILSFFIILIGSIFAFSARWSIRYFGLSCFEQIVFHLKVPLEGTNTEFITDWVKKCMVPAIITTMGSIGIFLLLTHITVLKTIPFFSYAAFILMLTLLYSGWITGLLSYILNQFRTTDFYENFYVDSKSVKLDFPEQKKNLIYIFVESLETTYAKKKMVEIIGMD